VLCPTNSVLTPAGPGDRIGNFHLTVTDQFPEYVIRIDHANGEWCSVGRPIVPTGRVLLGVLLSTAGTALVAVLAIASPALAHNSLTGSDPPDGATVARPPDTVRLTFLASLDPLNTHVTVAEPGGEPVAVDQPDIDGSRVTIPLPAGPAGEYRVADRVLSSDGDWVEGSVGFTVGASEPASPSPPDRIATTGPPATPAGSPTAGLAGSPGPPAAGTGSGPADRWPWLAVALGLAAAGAAAGLIAYRRRARPG
jgi:hypothetical protein